MPHAPAVVGALAESLMGRPARVIRTEQLTATLQEIHLRARPPRGGWRPGHEVQVRVTPTDSRRYTVHAVHPDEPDRINLLVSLEAGGPGTAWARSLVPGSDASLLAGAHVPLRLPGKKRLHLGDASTLGAFDAQTTASNSADPVVLEVPSDAVRSL